jgi:hypothetical protein
MRLISIAALRKRQVGYCSLLSVESEKCELIKGASFAWLVQLNLVAASVHSVFLGT